MSDGRGLAHKQMIATENIQSHEAIVLVVAVKEAAKLMAVDWIIGGVDVQDDSLRRYGMGLADDGRKFLGFAEKQAAPVG
jgi:hypothetical protein